MDTLTIARAAYVMPPEFHTLKREEQTLFIDPVNHIWFVTDQYGEAALKGFAKNSDMEEACEELALSVGAPPSDSGVRGYIDTFFSHLHNVGFLHEKAYTKRVLPSAPLEYPKVMYLHLTSKCNLSCSYCYNQEHRFNLNNEIKAAPKSERLARPVQTEKFKKVLTDAAAFGLSQVKLTGGEAMLYKDFLAIAQHAKSLGIYVNLLTNGALVTAENAPEIVKSVDSVSISIDSKEADGGHDAIRGSGSHGKALAAVKHLREAGLQYLHVNGVISPTTLEGVEELLDFSWNELGAGRVTLAGTALNVNDPNKRWGAEEHMLTGEEYSDLELRQYGYYQRVGMAEPASFRNHCGVGNGVVSVESNGDVYPCQTLHDKEFLFGNAFDKSLGDVLDHSPVRHASRAANVDQIPECNVCPVRYICSSGCRSEAYTREGNFLARNKDMCPTYFKIAVNKLWDSVAVKPAAVQ